MLTLRSLLSLVVSLAFSFAPSASAGEEPTLEQRLEKLTELLEKARVKAHVPGMSIAIVKDDEVVFARGFGLADLESERAADAETIYAIGSTTKAFTATLVGMLADEGKLTWDDPVVEYLPYFELAVESDDPAAQATLRDLLSHRHGFSRMGLLWFAGKTSREEILRTAAGAEPLDGFRKGFHYCNVTYLAAGEAAGAADDTSWDELMLERIFEPLEMTSSTLNTAQAQKDPRLALGYDWDEVDEAYEHLRMAELHSIAPAGSVNSNVLDMAQWLRLLLGTGEVDEMQLITPERLRETWMPQIPIAGGVSYGLGWMLRDYKGRQLVEHGGNINGFSAQVALLPEENLGYVLLMNRNVSPLSQASIQVVFDALLEEWPDETVATAEAGASPDAGAGELDFEEYTGTYLANFATFRDEEFEVRLTESGLELHIPSQQTFELRAPDDEGRWTFALTDQIAVTFDRDDAGEVVGLVMHQNQFAFEVPREGVSIEPDVPVEELEKYAGTYVHTGGKRIEFLIKNGQLTLEDGGNRIPFHAPDAEGHATMRPRADQGATFQVDAEGSVSALVFHGGAGDRLFTRLGTAPDEGLPTLDELFALRRIDERSAALEAAGGRKTTGKIWVPQAGVHGELTVYTRGKDCYADHADYGKFGRVVQVASGYEAWAYNPMQGTKTLNGEELTQAVLGHPGAVAGDWRTYFDRIEVVRNDTLDERPVHVVRLTRGDFPSRTYWIDAESGDVLRVKMIAVESSVRIPITASYFDFVEVDGIRSPTRVETENPESGRSVLTFEETETGLELGDDIFRLEE